MAWSFYEEGIIIPTLLMRKRHLNSLATIKRTLIPVETIPVMEGGGIKENGGGGELKYEIFCVL
jgi:hypothetical protein